MAGIKDVAKMAGVAISTVSHALNGTKHVDEKLKERIIEAAKELNYEADVIARNMRKKRTNSIGIVTVDVCGLFYPYVLKGVYSIASKYGYNVSIFDTNITNDTKSIHANEMEGIKHFAANQVDGIIFTSMVDEESVAVFTKEILEYSQSKKKTALVCIERDFSDYGIDSIFSNCYDGAKRATSYLLRIGCRNIGHITGPIHFKISQDRMKGYIDAIESSGKKVDSDSMIAYGDYTHQSGYIGMLKLMQTMPNIDGIFIANDQMAIGACMALKEYKKRIPTDIKVIGYDDVFISSVIDPPLSTMHVSKHFLGAESARVLINQIEGKNRSQQVLRMELEPKLVIRKSTDINASTDHILSEW